jgi:hypothetical protein
MADFISNKLFKKTGITNLPELLSNEITSAELSSLLLEVYHRRSKHIDPAALLRHYQENIYVQPADTDMITSLEKELQILRYLNAHEYTPVELSPVAQFGSCSAVGTVSQHKIITALRHCEVMADATNALALHIANLKQSDGSPDSLLRFCTIHRHIRSMQLPRGKGYTPHFKIACMVAGGIDTGHFSFELNNAAAQLQHIFRILELVGGITDSYCVIRPRGGYNNGDELVRALAGYLQSLFPSRISVDEEQSENNYYKGFQYKVYIRTTAAPLEIADGGMVDWTQQLLSNRKQRCIIAGIGLSLLLKLSGT